MTLDPTPYEHGRNVRGRILLQPHNPTTRSTQTSFCAHRFCSRFAGAVIEVCRQEIAVEFKEVVPPETEYTSTLYCGLDIDLIHDFNNIERST